MTKKDFIFPGNKRFNNRYMVSATGRVFSKKTGKELNYHLMPNGGKFVRLCGGNCIVRSMSVAKMVLLTFSPNQYRMLIRIHRSSKKEIVAIHIDGDITNDKRSNLMWGTRSDQATTAMKKLSNFDRVSRMSRTYYQSLKK